MAEPRPNKSETRLVGLNLQDPSVSEFRAMCMEALPQMSMKMKMTLRTSLVTSTKRLQMHLHQVHQAQEIHGDRGTSIGMSLRHSLALVVIATRQSAQ